MARSVRLRSGNGLTAAVIGVPVSEFMRKTLKNGEINVNNGLLLPSASWILLPSGLNYLSAR
jgi:hypothetical protein